MTNSKKKKKKTLCTSRSPSFWLPIDKILSQKEPNERNSFKNQ
jgi:hypothetical protein